MGVAESPACSGLRPVNASVDVSAFVGAADAAAAVTGLVATATNNNAASMILDFAMSFPLFIQRKQGRKERLTFFHLVD